MIPSFFSKAHYRIPATIRVKPRPLNCTDSPDGKKSHLFQPFAVSEKGSLVKVIPLLTLSVCLRHETGFLSYPFLVGVKLRSEKTRGDDPISGKPPINTFGAVEPALSFCTGL